MPLRASSSSHDFTVCGFPAIGSNGNWCSGLARYELLRDFLCAPICSRTRSFCLFGNRPRISGEIEGGPSPRASFARHSSSRYRAFFPHFVHVTTSMSLGRLEFPCGFLRLFSGTRGNLRYHPPSLKSCKTSRGVHVSKHTLQRCRPSWLRLFFLRPCH